MSETSRLSRWSQRKLAARHGGALPEPADIAAEKIRPGDETVPAERKQQEPSADGLPVQTPVVEQGVDASAPSDTDIPDLPSIESLTAQSDYTVFLKKNVPEALRKAALRKLWVSDPVLANLDGLNDYDGDYSIVTAMTMDDTSYKIGRGFLEDDEPKPELEPASDPALEANATPQVAQTGDAPAESESDAVGAADESQASSDAQDGADGADSEAVANGNSDAPPVTSHDGARPVGPTAAEGGGDPGESDEKSRADTAI